MNQVNMSKTLVYAVNGKSGHPTLNQVNRPYLPIYANICDAQDLKNPKSQIFRSQKAPAGTTPGAHSLKNLSNHTQKYKKI